jgi:predicted permease
MQDLRHAFRLLRRTPGFTVVAVLVLALGIGANAAVFSIVNALMLRRLPGRVNELVGVFNADRTRPGSYRSFSYPAYLDIRDNNDVFDNVMAQMASLVGVGEGDATRRVFAMVVSSNYFRTVAVPLAAGRAFSPEEERPGAAMLVAVASYDAWRARNFERDLVGSTVNVNGMDFTVVGVAPEGFTGTGAIAGPEWWFPLGAYDQVVNDFFREGGAGLATRSHAALMLAGTLKPAVSLTDAQGRLDPLARGLAEAYPDTDRDRAFTLAPLRRIGMGSSPQADDLLPLISGLLLAMSALVLVVACLNLANLMLARGNARRREIAVRMALGGGRVRIVRQLMTEALVLSIAGAAAGVVIAWWTPSFLAASMTSSFPISISIDVAPDMRVVAATSFFAILSTIAFALRPAWSLSEADLVSDTKSDSRTTGLRGRSPRLVSGPRLIVAQLALSLALVATGGLFVRGALTITDIDAGHSFDRQLVVSVDPSLAGFDDGRGRELYRASLERLRGLGGVEAASFASSVAFGEITEHLSVRLPGESERAADPVFRIVGADYFQTLGLRMLSGREFAVSDETASPRAATLAIVNSPPAERLFGCENPVGRQIQVRARNNEPHRTLEIIGAAPGLRHDLFDPGPVPHIYVAFGGEYRANMNFDIRVADASREAEMLATVARELRQVESRLPIVALQTMTAHRDKSFLAWTIGAAAGLFGAFGVLALLLATIGVYGLEAYDVSRRTREIGIRMALGARAADVARLVLSDGLRATIWGLAIGLVLAVGIGRLVSGVLFRVTPFDPVVLTVAALILSAAALLACAVPLRRATRVEPIEALRTE